MTDRTRRTLLKIAAASSVATVLPAQHQHDAISGPLSNAIVNFGQWRTDPTLDRFAGSPPPANVHLLTPHEVTIKAGGAVSFVIAGFHLLLIYDNGTQPGNIDVTKLIPGPPVPLIDDPTNRIYRGNDPRAQTLVDRVEAVQFPKTGTYLVVCGVLPHFVNDHMFSFVNVLP